MRPKKTTILLTSIFYSFSERKKRQAEEALPTEGNNVNWNVTPLLGHF